jgi:cytochrome c peroxidase
MRNLLLALCITGLASAAFALPFEPLPAKPPIPANNPQSPAKIELGKKLYFDPRISKPGTISCNSCHNVMLGGDDSRPNSVGHKGQTGARSAPTVWNSAFLSVQFWDGRAKSLEEQAKGPLTNPIEMGMESHDVVLFRIRQVPGYITEFRKVFTGIKNGNDITIDMVAKAIASYERTLISGDSPFDLYMRGKKSALSPAALRGMKTVQDVGCTGCHMGVNFAGPPMPEGTGFYQKFPMFPGSEYDQKYDLLKDQGRFEVTNAEQERNFWRVPTWRNIALTAPYFHNGAVKTLKEAVRVMGKTQLNKDLKDDQVSDIVAFLESLTGKFPTQTMPRLPETSGVSIVE